MVNFNIFNNVRTMTSKQFFLLGFAFNLVLLFLVAFVAVVSADGGVWIEPSMSNFSTVCNGNNYVMCAEDGPHYDAVNGTIPYFSENGTNKTNMYCALVRQGDESCKFELLNGSLFGINSLASLKNSTKLCTEDISANNFYVSNYDSVENYYDENCNGDEIFVRGNDTKLNLSLYVENNKTFIIGGNQSNVDGFDLYSGIGTGFTCNYVDSQTGLPLSGVNSTLYFDNPVGDLTSYRNYITTANGSVNSFTNTFISTYYRNFTTNLIPCTKYVLVGKHENYTDSVKEFDFNLPNCNPSLSNICEMSSIDQCNSDCTIGTGSLCEKTCDGRNGCQFGNVGGLSLAPYLDKVPAGISVQRNISGNMYDIDTCEGSAYSANIVQADADCAPGLEVWKTSKLVILNGRAVRMIVTVCK